MGRARKYATEEEAHEAKKKQMRENYQKRKAAKAGKTEKKSKKEIPKELIYKTNTIEESVAEMINTEPKAEYLKWSKEELLTKVLRAVGDALIE